MERNVADDGGAVKANRAVLQRGFSYDTTFKGKSSTLLPLHIAKVPQAVDNQLFILFREPLMLNTCKNRIGFQIRRDKKCTESRTIHIGIPNTERMQHSGDNSSERSRLMCR